MGGGEEQRAVEAVGDDVLAEQRVFFRGVVAGLERDLLQAGARGHRPRASMTATATPDPDRGDQVERDGDGERQGEDERVGTGGARQRARIDPVSTIRMEVANRTPARAARGMSDDEGVQRRRSPRAAPVSG